MENASVQTESSLVFSANRDTILAKLFEAKKAIGLDPIVKNAKNAHLGNTYADINAVLERVEPILMDLGVMSLSSSTLDLEQGTVTVTTELIHIESQQSVRRAISFKPPKLDPQAAASCESYGRRYNHMGLFNLRSEDDDGNAGSGTDRSTSGAKAPTTKQLDFAKRIAQEKGVVVPDEAVNSMTACSAFIDKMKGSEGKAGTGKKAETGNKSSGQDSALSEAGKTALNYINKVDVGEMGACRKRVNAHGSLSDAEKKHLLGVIKEKEQKHAKAS